MLEIPEMYSTGIVGYRNDHTKKCSISEDGVVTLRRGYAWDGPSGPTIDTYTFMRGSLFHDALYQLMREGVLPLSTRKHADEILRDICLEDGMSKIRAAWVYRGVRIGGNKNAVSNVLSAPQVSANV